MPQINRNARESGIEVNKVVNLKPQQQEQKNSFSLKTNPKKSLPITVEVELDFGTYFYYLKQGKEILGTYSRYGKCIRATSLYNQSNHSFHETHAQARAEIISAYLKQPVALEKIPQTKYLVQLESEPVLEGVTYQFHKEVRIDADATIDWDLWVERFSQEMGSSFTLISVEPIRGNDCREAEIILTPLSSKKQNYSVSFENQRLGSIKEVEDGFLAASEERLGAKTSNFKTINLAKNWLFLNCRKIEKSGIEFTVNAIGNSYTISSRSATRCARTDLKIEIEAGAEDCTISVNCQNQREIAYFPETRSAIAYSFDLILNHQPINPDNNHTEF